MNSSRAVPRSGFVLPGMSIWMPLLLMAAALIIRLPELNGMIPIGDEWGTMREVMDFSNLHALSYFAFLRVWVEVGGGTPEWMRLFSVLCGVLSVGAMWLWLKPARGTTIALVAALLIALSPMALYYSRLLRFYGYHLLIAILFFAAYFQVAFSQQKPKPTQIAALIGIGLLFGTSLLMAWLCIGLTILHYAIFRLKIPRWVYAVGILAVVVGLGILVAFFPNVMNEIFLFAQRAAVGSTVQQYTVPRGITILTFGKLGLQYHKMVLGMQVYPFDLHIVIPALLLTTAILIIGAWRLWNTNRFLFGFALIIGVGHIMLLYLVVDALLPPEVWRSIEIRYTLAAAPIFIWVVAEGIVGLGRRIGWIGGAAFLIFSAIGIVSYYNPTQRDDSDRVLPAYAINEDAETRPVMIVADGRSSALIDYYIPMTENVTRGSAFDDVTPQLNQMPPGSGVYWMSNDWRRQFACQFNRQLETLSAWNESYAFVFFPQFVYGYDLGTPAAVREDGGVPLPRVLFGLALQDLSLPQTFVWREQTRSVGGMMTLPTCESERGWRRDGLAGSAERLLLASHLYGANSVPDGTLIGHLEVTAADGAVTRLEVRKGAQTQSWNAGACAGCESVVRWRKFFHPVGNSGYPEAYQDFTAHIWGAELALNGQTDIESIALEVEPDFEAEWNIWGLYLLDS
jgi:hypothetical protein